MIDRAVRLARASSSTTSVIVLVLFNLIPLVGVVFWGWNVATILVLYWVENGIVGLLNVPKMLLAQGAETPSTRLVGAGGSALTSRAGAVGFFLVHYGIFWFVHGIFVFTLPFLIGLGSLAGGTDPLIDPGTFGPGALPAGGVPDTVDRTIGPDLGAVGLGAIGLAISHGVSFVVNFVGQREYLRTTIGRQMFAPYGRLVILHLTILFGAFLSLAIGSPVGAIVVLVILKTILDLGFHLREHGRLGAVVQA